MTATMPRPPKATLTPEEFAERLKAWRANADLTVREAAKVLQVSPTTVTRWESGLTKPSLAMVRLHSKTIS